MISPELVERMKDWRHSGFHAYAGEEISDIEDALRVGLYMVRGPAATSRLRADPAQEPKVRYLAKETVPDHGEERVSSGHRDYDYLEWIARLTSHIPDRGTLRRCGTISSPTRSRTTVHSKTTGGRTSIHPIPLDARRMRGFRVDPRPMVSILTAKDRWKLRQAVRRSY